MQSETETLSYEWIEAWAKLPAMSGHSHHGMAIDRRGRIVTGHATEPRILILSQDGDLLESFETPVKENHGICIARRSDDSDYLLIADSDGSQVVACDFQGRLLHRIGKEDLPGYASDTWFGPTAVSWNPRNGEIWIADGYGSNRVFRLSADHEVLAVLKGCPDLPFNQPHWVFVDTRREQTRIYVADRSNDRVQVFDEEGGFLRCFGEGVLRTPSVFATWQDYLIIGELKARLVICDGEDRIVSFLGDGLEHCAKPGWPNRLGADGKPIPPHADLPAGQFNSPHGICADRSGNIYISEWLLGDRFIKLRRRA